VASHKKRAVHLGTESLAVDDDGGGGSGLLTEMLNWLGSRVSRLVIDETDSTDEKTQWRDYLARSMNEITADTETGRAILKGVLEKVSQHTSLTFHQERRNVVMWGISSGS
jgi:hypothetical protein